MRIGERQLLNGNKGWATHRVIALKEDDTTTLVTCSKVVTGMVKLDRRDDIGCGR